MCVIIDANQLGDLANRDIASPGMERLHEWIEKRGKVVYLTSGQYADEIHNYDYTTRPVFWEMRGRGEIVV